MSRLKERIVNHPRYAKALHWGKLVTITGSAQIIVQAVGFISGILVVRLLPVEEYALYTLANTMLGTMTVLSDGGISTGVMAQGGKVWQNKIKLGAVLATGLELRRKFAIFSLLVSIPILCYLLLSHGASWVMAVLISASLIPAFFAALSDTLLQIPPKLHQAILPLQRNQVEVGIGRLALTAVTLFAFPWAFIAIIASGIPRIYGNIKLRKIANVFVDKEQESAPEVRSEIVKVVKRSMPEAIYFCLSGQIMIWIISIFGTTSSIAQIGALSRFAAILVPINMIITTLVIPRFAKLKYNRKILLKNYLHILILVLCLSIVVVSLCSFFSSELLWILGDKYEGLNTQLVLVIVNNCLFYFVSSASFTLSLSRSWVMHPVIPVISSLLSMIVGVLFFNVSNLTGVLQFNIFITSVRVVINVFFMFRKISKIE